MKRAAERQQKAGRLTLFFDEEGVLRHYGHSTAFDELDPLQAAPPQQPAVSSP